MCAAIMRDIVESAKTTVINLDRITEDEDFRSFLPLKYREIKNHAMGLNLHEVYRNDKNWNFYDKTIQAKLTGAWEKVKLWWEPKKEGLEKD